MTSELIVWHDLDGYSRGVVNGHDRYLIQPVALEGFHGFELLKPTSEGDLQLGYYKRVSTAKQIAEDREAARARRSQQRERDDAEIAQSRFHRRTGAEETGVARRFHVGSVVVMNDDALSNYGEKYRGRKFIVQSVSTKYMPSSEFFAKGKPDGYHPGYDDSSGAALYDLEGLNNSLYDWELEAARGAREASESRPWPRRGGVREDGGPSGALDWKQHGGDWVAKTFGGASYRLVPEGEDGFHTYYERGGHKEDLGGHPTLGAAMGAARRHRPPMSRAAEEGGAEERVPVVHEDGVEAAVVSVTKSETVTVAAAQEAGGSEDFSTVGHAEQHAYTEGFRFIAKHGKRYHVYKRKPVGKKGYERREMYHRRGKWHISGDRKTVSRLGEGARAIKVSQTAGTIRKEELPPEAPRDEPAAAAGESGETFYIVDTRIGKAVEGPYADVDDADRAMRNYNKRTHQVIAGRYLNDLAFQGDGAKVQRGAGEDAKFERCVRAVKKRGGAVNPYAVCTTSVGQGREGGGRLTLAQAKAELRPLGLVLISHDGEYRVNFRRGDEESAYYTPDLDDAVATGKDMAKRSASEAAEDHLTTAQRSRLPASAFAMPEQRKLPIQNRKHVRAAASRLSMMLHDGTISQADHDRALKRVQRAGRRLGVNVSAAASEAYEPAKEDPAGVGCAPCDAAVEERQSSRKSSTKDADEDLSKPLQGGCVAIVERTPDCIPTGVNMETPRDVYDFMAPRYAKLGGEHFFVLLVSNQGELLGNPIEVAKGQPDRVAVDIEQIIAAAITGAAAGARGFVVSHGHPSGGEYARPSVADKRLTKDIEASAKIACPSTVFIDHVICCAPAKSGVGSYYSFEEDKVVKVRDTRSSRRSSTSSTA